MNQNINFIKSEKVKGIDDSYSSTAEDQKIDDDFVIKDFRYRFDVERPNKNIIRKRALNKLKLGFVKEVNDSFFYVDFMFLLFFVFDLTVDFS